jgi:hypothetical protein
MSVTLVMGLPGPQSIRPLYRWLHGVWVVDVLVSNLAMDLIIVVIVPRCASAWLIIIIRGVPSIIGQFMLIPEHCCCLIIGLSVPDNSCCLAIGLSALEHSCGFAVEFPPRALLRFRGWLLPRIHLWVALLWYHHLFPLVFPHGALLRSHRQVLPRPSLPR